MHHRMSLLDLGGRVILDVVSGVLGVKQATNHKSCI